MLPPFIDPYSSNTYKVFRTIISIYLLAGVVNLICMAYPTDVYTQYRFYVLLALTVLHVASFGVLLVIAEYSRQPVWAMGFLWVWFLWNIFFGVLTSTEPDIQAVMKWYMLSGLIGFMYIFILFKLQDRYLGAYFKILAGSHLLVFSIKIMYQIAPGIPVLVFSIVELLPIVCLLLLVQRTIQDVKNNEVEDDFPERMESPGQ